MSAEKIKTDRINAALLKLPEKPAVHNLPVFKKGESLLAQVMSAKGEQITFKTPEGRFFSANIRGNIQLKGGENVELIVKENLRGRVVLQLLTVETAAGAPKELLLDVSGLKDKGSPNIVKDLFEQIGIKPSQLKIQNALNIMKDSPALNEKAAVFFVANNIPANEQNVAAVQKLITEKKGIGEQLIELIIDLDAAQEENMNAPGTAKPERQTPAKPDFLQYKPVPEGSEKVLAANGGEKAPFAANGAVNNKEIKPAAANDYSGKTPTEYNKENKPVNMELHPSMTQMPADIDAKNVFKLLEKFLFSNINGEKAPLIVKDAAGQVKTILWPEIGPPADQVENAVPYAKTQVKQTENNAAQTLAAPAEQPREKSAARDILLRILSMFANLDEGDYTELKKAKNSAAEELDLLKGIILESDMKHKNDFALKTGELASREKLTSDINRYVCLHIPVVINQTIQTAEVYIYKRNRHGKKIDKENTVISIGLDMSHMGRVEAVIQIEKKNINLVFKLENENASAVIKERTTRLYQQLQEIGYRLTDTKISQLLKKTTVIDVEEELVKAADRKPVFIDYKI